MKEVAMYWLKMIETEWGWRKLADFLRVLVEEERKKKAHEGLKSV